MMATNRNPADNQSDRNQSNRNTDARGTLVSSQQEEEQHPWAAGLNDDELAHMPYLDPGTLLEQGGSYLDLNQLNGGPFTPSGSQTVGEGDRIIAQRDVDPELWGKLVGEG